MGQLIMLMAITYFVAEIVILFHLKCPPDVPQMSANDPKRTSRRCPSITCV